MHSNCQVDVPLGHCYRGTVTTLLLHTAYNFILTLKNEWRAHSFLVLLMRSIGTDDCDVCFIVDKQYIIEQYFTEDDSDTYGSRIL